MEGMIKEMVARQATTNRAAREQARRSTRDCRPARKECGDLTAGQRYIYCLTASGICQWCGRSAETTIDGDMMVRTVGLYY